jgi:hypothetical protein
VGSATIDALEQLGTDLPGTRLLAIEEVERDRWKWCQVRGWPGHAERWDRAQRDVGIPGWTELMATEGAPRRRSPRKPRLSRWPSTAPDVSRSGDAR